MSRLLLVAPLLMGSALALCGCVAGMAASAVSLAARGAQGEKQSNHHLRPAAASACSAHASQYGSTHIIDVEQRSTSKIIVWGTVDDGKVRRAFECSYGSKLTGFKLRAITPQR